MKRFESYNEVQIFQASVKPLGSYCMLLNAGGITKQAIQYIPSLRVDLIEWFNKL